MALRVLTRRLIRTVAATIMLSIPLRVSALAEAVTLDSLPADPAGWTAMGSGADKAKRKATLSTIARRRTARRSRLELERCAAPLF